MDVPWHHSHLRWSVSALLIEALAMWLCVAWSTARCVFIGEWARVTQPHAKGIWWEYIVGCGTIMNKWYYDVEEAYIFFGKFWVTKMEHTNYKSTRSGCERDTGRDFVIIILYRLVKRNGRFPISIVISMAANMIFSRDATNLCGHLGESSR